MFTFKNMVWSGCSLSGRTKSKLWLDRALWTLLCVAVAWGLPDPACSVLRERRRGEPSPGPRRDDETLPSRHRDDEPLPHHAPGAHPAERGAELSVCQLRSGTATFVALFLWTNTCYNLLFW